MRGIVWSVYVAFRSVWRLLVPRYVRLRLDAEAFSNERFARRVGQGIKSGAVVLDAGAGGRPYERFFGGARYYSTDWVDARDGRGQPLHEFLSSVDHLPVHDDWADAITAFQVLDHTPEPEEVLREVWRVLRPGGAFHLTVPQGWGLNLEPHHYYGFTRYGLEHLLRKTGFESVQISERGGMLWLLAKRIKILPYYILFQYVYPLARPNARVRGLSESTLVNVVMAVLLTPVFLITLPFFGLLIPLLLFYLDPLDRRKLYTLGYECSCTKPIAATGG